MQPPPASFPGPAALPDSASRQPRFSLAREVDRYFTRLLSLLACVFALFASQSARAASSTWDAGAGGGDINWSSFDNWSDNAAPSDKDIIFNNTGGAAVGTITSILDTSYTINSLNFQQDNTSNQTLSIPGSQTLTVNGSFTPTSGGPTAVLFGQPNVSGTTASTTNITGLGTLTVNSTASHFLVGYANATGNPTITVNMSGLSNFNATVDIFGVGRKGTTSADASRQQAGFLTLAKNNTITANEISVGSTTHINGTTGNHNNGGTSTLNLGSGGGAVNNLYADKMSFGIGKATGNMNFAAGVVASDTVTIRAKNTTGAVGTFEVGVRNMSSSSGTPAGTVNFGAGKVDAVITTLNVGQWASGAGTSGVDPTGTFTIGTNAASTVTVTTLNLANSGSSNAVTARVVTGNLNVTGGVFSATTVNLATGTATSGLTKTANLNVDGGTFRFGAFGSPTGTNAVAINFKSGTVASINGTASSLGLAYNLGKTGGSTVTFGQSSGGTGTISLNGAGTLLGNTTVATVQETTLGGAVGGAFSLTKTGAATLIINQNQNYSGGTIISNGIIKMSASKTFASGSNMEVGASGTWQLDGTSQTLGELTGTGLVTSTWATSGFDTLTVGSGDATSTFDGTIAGGNGTSVRGVNLTKTGAGTLTLTAANTYSGNTTVSAGNLTISTTGGLANSGNVIITNSGSLLVGANEAINNGAAVSLGGGTLKMGGAFTETLGALTLTANSILDFGSGNSVFNFLNGESSGFTPGDFTLTISNWTSAKQLVFTGNQQANIDNAKFTFIGFSSISQTSLGDNQYAIVAVPEPGTILAGLLLLGGLFFFERKRMRRLFAAVATVE